MAQGNQPFSVWWSMVKEQAEKCTFDNYTKDKAARDAILFQTSDVKLQKKVLAEDTELEDMVKLGLANEHTATKLDQMGGRNGEEASVSMWFEKRLNALNWKQNLKTK